MSLFLISLFFILAPFPWATILCIILYRYDLSRLFHPSKNGCSKRDWRSVLEDLHFSHKRSAILAEASGKRSMSFTSIGECLTEFLEGHEDLPCYITALGIASGASLLSSLVLGPCLAAASPRLVSHLGVVFSAAFQVLAAVPTVFAMERFFGPFPSPPNRYHLQKHRLGSLLRYERTLDQRGDNLPGIFNRARFACER